MSGSGSPPDARPRPYEPSDRAACLDVFETNVPAFFVEAERAGFEEYLDALPGPYLVLETPAGRVVGCGGWALDRGTGRADLCWGMVRRELHGLGLGRRLAEARIDQVRAHGAAREIVLNTSQHTTGFYRRLGFEVRSVEPDGYAPGLDRCVMGLELGGP